MALLAHGYLVEPAGNGGWIVAPMRGVVEPVHAFAAFTTGADLLDWLRREHEEIESQAKASEDNGAGNAPTRGGRGMAGEVSRLVSGRTDTATSERMDVTVVGDESGTLTDMPRSAVPAPSGGKASKPGDDAGCAKSGGAAKPSVERADDKSGVIRAPLVGPFSAPGGSASYEIPPFILSAGPIHFAAPENLTVKPDDWPELPETLRRASC